MKILHINTAQHGGAALCAIRINKALKSAGVDTKMLFAEGDGLPQDVEGAIACKDHKTWQSVPFVSHLFSWLQYHSPFIKNVHRLQYLVDQANTDHLYLHIPLSQYENIVNHPLVDWADIIHLHWVSDFVDYPSFFRKIKKPIVWTLHDKYPAVGLQHYSSEFYPVPEQLKTLDDYCRTIKRESVAHSSNLNLVAISEKMVDICNHSDVLKGFPVTVIHNGVDVDTFKKYDKEKARKELGLIPESKIFLFSGYNIHDPNKGLNRVIEALERINVPNKILVCIGMSNMPMPDASFPIILTGLIGSQVKISKYYSAADLFIQSSYEETFSQTCLEAVACGTPVVAFPFCGAHDIINETNGIICDDFSVDALAKGITQVMGRTYHSESICEDAIQRFSYDIIAQQYMDLYKTILKS